MGLFHKVMNKLGRYRLIPDRRTGADICIVTISF
jgi:hypothetical protein